MAPEEPEDIAIIPLCNFKSEQILCVVCHEHQCRRKNSSFTFQTAPLHAFTCYPWAGVTELLWFSDSSCGN